MSYMPSSYLNALREEGTREDLLRELGRLYDENERLRAALKEIARKESPLYSETRTWAGEIARAALRGK